MNPTRTARTVAPVLAFLLAGTALAGCSKHAAVATGEAPLTVSVAKVAARTMHGGLTASGLLVSRQEVGVASELSGYRIAEVYVDEGAQVSNGQPLVRLDDTLLRAQIDQSRANLAQQQVAAERAQAEAARVNGLDNQGVISDEAIAERRLQGKAGQAGAAVAQAQLNDLLTRDSLMTIRAPMGGLVLERTARPGDISATGVTLFRISGDDLVELDAEVPEADLHALRIGDHAQVQIPSGAHVDGTIRFISPRIDPQTKLGRARIALPVRPDLRPGGYGQASFTGAARAVTAAPDAAVRFDADGASVMVVGADDRVHRVPVRTGQRVGGWVELLQGPAPGTPVALGGSAFVLEGDKVRVRDVTGSAG